MAPKKSNTVYTDDDLLKSVKSLTISDSAPAAPLRNTVVRSLSTSEEASENETTVISVQTNSDPFANGPMLNPEANWARMTCQECERKSIENFYFSSFYCQDHGSAIADQWRLDCVHRKCNRASYKLLHPHDNEQTFQCGYHCLNDKSRIFGTRFRTQSKDFLLQAGDRENVLISGKDFDKMAFDYSYSSEIKDNIRQVIQEFQDLLNFDSVEAAKKKHEGIMQGLDANKDCDDKELRNIHGQYRDKLAQGYVYAVLYKNDDTPNSGRLSIKIGYSKDVDKRIEGYKCKTIYRRALAVIPSEVKETRNGLHTTLLSPLFGVHLLEQILHAVLVQRQRDHPCNCGQNGRRVTHAEVFVFEPVHGVPDELEAALIRVEDLKKQMNGWLDIIRKAESAFKDANEAHKPIFSAIQQKLKQAGRKPIY
ncbi:hypothetical protein EMPS_01671 [Entomortierella parvispora]|uniref:Bacteriophage T5 Orf172 DNA-binding domain-containing protein n=1 Tax=Entomortierella parvispora TaxID=205924 RepID=A0A9P3LT67_9FUNG|nr:hypothetical protein EMPS_01671 [Entomortierella parvispora]